MSGQQPRPLALLGQRDGVPSVAIDLDEVHRNERQRIERLSVKKVELEVYPRDAFTVEAVRIAISLYAKEKYRHLQI